MESPVPIRWSVRGERRPLPLTLPHPDAASPRRPGPMQLQSAGYLCRRSSSRSRSRRQRSPSWRTPRPRRSSQSRPQPFSQRGGASRRQPRQSWRRPAIVAHRHREDRARHVLRRDHRPRPVVAAGHVPAAVVDVVAAAVAEVVRAHARRVCDRRGRGHRHEPRRRRQVDPDVDVHRALAEARECGEPAPTSPPSSAFDTNDRRSMCRFIAVSSWMALPSSPRASASKRPMLRGLLAALGVSRRDNARANRESFTGRRKWNQRSPACVHPACGAAYRSWISTSPTAAALPRGQLRELQLLPARWVKPTSRRLSWASRMPAAPADLRNQIFIRYTRFAVHGIRVALVPPDANRVEMSGRRELDSATTDVVGGQAAAGSRLEASSSSRAPRRSSSRA